MLAVVNPMSITVPPIPRYVYLLVMATWSSEIELEDFFTHFGEVNSLC